MDDRDLQFIQDQIGYTFKNSDLLQQAFVRRSYSKENGGGDNEVLEFIGDKALDICVIIYLIAEYGHMADEAAGFSSDDDWNEFFCDLDEGELTDLKRKLVEKKMLSHRIDTLGLSDFLIMGNGDIQNNISQQSSVKEDLFEAIIGAVTLDSHWNMDEIQSTVDVMLDPESELNTTDSENYVQLIQDWVQKKHGSIPLSRYENLSYSTSWRIPFGGVSQRFDIGKVDYLSLKHCCYLIIDNHLPIFRGFGTSRNAARKGACETAYHYLEHNHLILSIKDEIEDPNKDDAINQLEILARRDYFELPTYEFTESHDNDGNPVWDCNCNIPSLNASFHARSSSKKDAKKAAAFSMLQHVLR